MSEGRHVELRMGSKEDHPKFWGAAGAYATEIVYKGEEHLEQPFHMILAESERGGKPHAYH
jgi:hypothetical protein